MPLRGCRILVLDDDPMRHRFFARTLIGNVVEHVNTFDHCIKALQENQNPFDVVFLDHDLNDHGLLSIGPSEMYGGVREMTGADVARFITNKLSKEKYPELIIIHSVNDYGSANMHTILKPTNIKVERIPFSSMNDSMFT